MQGEIVWTRQPSAAPDDETLFTLDPVLGLMDVDFHPVDDRAWTSMKASAPGHAARLIVAPSVTLKRIAEALDELATKGSYRRVSVSLKSS